MAEGNNTSATKEEEAEIEPNSQLSLADNNTASSGEEKKVDTPSSLSALPTTNEVNFADEEIGVLPSSSSFDKNKDSSSPTATNNQSNDSSSKDDSSNNNDNDDSINSNRVQVLTTNHVGSKMEMMIDMIDFADICTHINDIMLVYHTRYLQAGVE